MRRTDRHRLGIRDDLRLSDHPALHAAVKAHAKVAFIYVLDDKAPGIRPLGGAARWWLAQSLRALQASLASGVHRWCCARDRRPRSSPTSRARPVPSAVFWNEIAQAPHRAVGGSGCRRARQRSASPRKAFPATCWSRRARSATRKDRGLRVFTPFWRRVQALGDPPKPLPAPKTLTRRAGHRQRHARGLAARAAPARLGRRPARDLDAGRSRRAGSGSRTFLGDGIAGYAGDRDRPDRDGTSRLSPHLRFGEISPRQVWHAARFAAAEHPRLSGDIDKFLSELGWREFCRHLLFDVPDLADAQSAARVRRLSLEARRQGACAPGSAAAPAIPSSMPACASSGTPA